MASLIHCLLAGLSPCGSIDFVALGDGRAHIDHLGPSAYWPGILSEVYTHEPAFILNTGDLVKRGIVTMNGKTFSIKHDFGRRCLPSEGNHDRGGLYQQYMASPLPVSAFTWGPVNVIGFDTEIPDSELDSALHELSRALEKRTAPGPFWFFIAQFGLVVLMGVMSVDGIAIWYL